MHCTPKLGWVCSMLLRLVGAGSGIVPGVSPFKML